MKRTDQGVLVINHFDLIDSNINSILQIILNGLFTQSH